MNSENIMLGERSQSQRITYCRTPFDETPRTDNSRDRKHTYGGLGIVVAGVVREMGSDCLWIWGFFCDRADKNDPKLTVVMVTQFCDYTKPLNCTLYMNDLYNM